MPTCILKSQEECPFTKIITFPVVLEISILKTFDTQLYREIENS